MNHRTSKVRHFLPVKVICIILVGISGQGCQGATPGNGGHAQPSTALKPSAGEEILLREGLVVSQVARYGRSAVHRDLIEAQMVAGTWTAPKEGDKLTGLDGEEKSWEKIEADENGWFAGRSLRGGYVYIPVEAQQDKVMIMHMRGNSMVYVNGVPRVGSRYQTKERGEAWEPTFDYGKLAIPLKKGKNDLLFYCTRGRLQVRMMEPTTEAMLNTADVTLGDLVAGEDVDKFGAVVVINATTEAQDNLYLGVSWGDQKEIVTKVGRIGSLAVRKVPFSLKGRAPQETESVLVNLVLMRGEENRKELLDAQTISVGVRTPQQTRKCTYLSKIDGSVQYYALNPVNPLEGEGKSRALVLSVHGASVEAINQSNAYAAKSWCDIVAATNRRPYGFDWEDWGRIDTLEVLELAKQQLQPDPGRIYLTGHSMGGHGTWILGSQYPDKFAAIGPSAGWISFWSYRGSARYEDAGTVEKILMRAESPGDTMGWSKNLAGKGIYILHGSADDNVSAKQSRMMVENLEKFHKDFVYHEEPNQGHWWDLSDEPGADCVDWAEMFDFFARHYLPGDESVRQVDFTTANPGVSAWSHWAGIEAQVKPLEFSSISIRFDPGQRRFVGTTENVERLALKLYHVRPGDDIQVELDGQKISNISYPKDSKLIRLVHVGYGWLLEKEYSKAQKGPLRNGPFKEAFNHMMKFVYGTAGTKEENAWAYAKARYDAEQFWYQGNGSVDIIADVEFDPKKGKDRGIILYGNSQTNTAWKKLLADSPVQVTHDKVTIGDREVAGDNLACLFLRPRVDSDIACVAAVSGTGIKGMRLTDRLPYIFAGCNYPDCIVIGPEMLKKGVQGVRLAGFFGNDWSVEKGDFAWRKDEQKQEELEQSEGLPANIAADPRPFVMPQGYVCKRALESITVDGKMEEKSWDLAPWTQYHVDIEGASKPPPRLKTRSKMLWDDEYFYIAAQLEEPHVWGTITQRNAVIFEDNDFEVFIDPDGDNHEYYEFEMNVLNTVWNLFMNHPYKNNGQAKIREMEGQKTGVYVKGTLNDPSDTDEYWTVEVAFPWQAMAQYAHRACPPKDGDQWRLGFSRVEWGHRIVDGKYVRQPSKQERTDDWHEDNWVWSPQGVVNMHRPETWGYVQFSSQPVGNEVEYLPDPTVTARYLIHQVHYAQSDFYERNKRYAENFAELCLGKLTHESLTSPITMKVSETGFVITAQVKVGDEQIRQVQIDETARIRER